jgi:hypothetical protein
MLIDDFLPVYDFSERHETKVNASRERTFAAIDSTDFSASWTIWGLLALRGLGWSHASKSVTLRDMTRDGFAVLGETRDEEISGRSAEVCKRSIRAIFANSTKKDLPKRSGIFRSSNQTAKRFSKPKREFVV